MSDILSRFVSENTVIVAAVDFSHGLKVNDALQNDEKTVDMILKKDYEGLLSLGDDYMDSPESLVLLLKTLEKIGRGQDVKIIHHSNSAELLNDIHSETTTYFSIRYY
jgi:AmmeMemoRadiSam system protein B